MKNRFEHTNPQENDDMSLPDPWEQEELAKEGIDQKLSQEKKEKLKEIFKKKFPKK